MGNYSKTFGLTFINDDHYYAKVAVFLNILNGFCRIAWGFNYDRFGSLVTIQYGSLLLLYFIIYYKESRSFCSTSKVLLCVLF